MSEVAIHANKKAKVVFLAAAVDVRVLSFAFAFCALKGMVWRMTPDGRWCTGRMHPRCVRPTTGTILFNFNTKEDKRRVVAAHAI